MSKKQNRLKYYTNQDRRGLVRVHPWVPKYAAEDFIALAAAFRGVQVSAKQVQRVLAEAVKNLKK